MASAPEETYDRSLGLCRRAVAARGGLRRSAEDAWSVPARGGTLTISKPFGKSPAGDLRLERDRGAADRRGISGSSKAVC
jgi:hypothetical protein